MVAIKEFLSQELDKLNEEQLRQVADFIAFIKFRAQRAAWQPNASQLAAIYAEFSEEDQRLAEEGLDEYTELLMKEDLQ